MGLLLEIKNLKKYFPVPNGVLHAVDDVSLQFEEGKTIGVVGESGCGKSTLGRTILRLGDPTSGQIIFDGEDITKADKVRLKELRRSMQMIFQDPFSSLNPRMSVTQAIAEPIKVMENVTSQAEINRRVRELMDTVGIANRFANSYPHELDGGRRQRIGIARALAVNPRFIVCDEPVSALDVSIQAQVINLLQDLQKEKKLTYMFITHDLSVVKHISDDICVMYLGQAVEKGESKRLVKTPLHPYTQALLSVIPSIDIDREKARIWLKCELVSPVDPPPGCRFAPRCPYATEACQQPQQLEELLPDHFVACCRAKELNKDVLS